MQACEFSRSFLTWRMDLNEQPSTTSTDKPNHTINNPRVQLECICDLKRLDSERTQRFVLGASCKTERVNIDRDIWKQPNADFCMVASEERFLIIKTYDHCGRKVMLYPPSLGEQPHRQMGLARGNFARLRADADVLETVEQVLDAGLANRPLIAITEFETDDGCHVRLEYPVKTINLGDREQFFQTDTGPVLYPQNPTTHAHAIESMQLAFIAANAPQWAELIVQTPTKLSDEITVNHYTEPRHIDCQNVMVALR